MTLHLSDLIDRAQDNRVLCVGDLMLDRFVYGTVDRISPESPVPVLRKSKVLEMPGGAGNVARNMAAMGLHVTIVGFVGPDDAGHRLEAILSDHKKIESRLIKAEGTITTVKSRFVASNQQLLRVDTESSAPHSTEAVDAICRTIADAAPRCSAIVVSDYAKGAIGEHVYAACVQAAREGGIPLMVDPKSKDMSIYAGADIIKPNAAELSSATGISTDTDEGVEAALERAEATLPGSKFIVTRAGKGMTWLDGGSVRHRRGEARQVFDVSGAGDTSMAAIALGIVGGAALEDAITLAVTASGIAVGKTGTATVDADELRRALDPKYHPLRAPVLDRQAIRDQVAGWKTAGLKVGFTNGCFDILHPGHLTLLEEARIRCDRLVVAINDDASVKRLKGESRPVNTQTDRARLLAGIGAVDAVTIFSEDTPAALIDLLGPDLLVKGGDYTIESIVGADRVIASGGEVHIVSLVDGQSTSAILDRSRS